MIDYDGLAVLFKTLDYKWVIAAKRQHPTAENLLLAIDRLTKELYDDGQQAEMGRLIVQKNGEHFDIYLHMGDTDDHSTVHQQD